MPESKRTVGSINPEENKHTNIIAANLFSYRSTPQKTGVSEITGLFSIWSNLSEELWEELIVLKSKRKAAGSET